MILLQLLPVKDEKRFQFLKMNIVKEMAFPHLFPTGKFGYKCTRDVSISPVKYFNQRLLNYTQKFASDTNYIFFCKLCCTTSKFKVQDQYCNEKDFRK